MAKAKANARRRRYPVKKQSLTKNIALLVLSIGVLAGASILFNTLNTRPEYSYAPIEKNLSKIVSKSSAKEPVQEEKPEPEKSSVGTYEYSFWDLLILQDKNSPDETESFTVQVASFKTREAAAQYAGELEGKTRFRFEVESRGKTFIVRWGNFHTREMAQRYCGTLSSRLQKPCAVVKL